MAEMTGGVTGAEKTGAEASAAAKSATPEPGGNGSVKNDGLEARFAELTGEIKRKNEKIEKLAAELASAKDAAKSEDDKRIEALATERFGPALKEADSLREFLLSERDQLVAQIPDEHKGMLVVGENIPIQQQITQARSVLAFLQKGIPPQPFSSGGNPGTETKRQYTRAEYDKWSNTVYSDREYYMKNQAEMLAAAREGRVQGL